MEVIKGNGEREEFDRDKLRESLITSGTSTILANEITTEIEKELKDGDSTSTIYKKAFQILHDREKKSAMRYSMKRSILTLGPTGFPFEEFVSEILRAKGYKTMRSQILKGKCLEHEIDVIAYNEHDLLIIEAKFHNQLGAKSDSKVALYVKARFDDLETEEFDIEGEKRKMTKGILITNTKFTNNAKKYVDCVGKFEVISWDHPRNGSLHDMIGDTGLQPITCVPNLSNSQKRDLLERGLVNCLSLKNNKKVLKDIGVGEDEASQIVDNIELICSNLG